MRNDVCLLFSSSFLLDREWWRRLRSTTVVSLSLLWDIKFSFSKLNLKRKLASQYPTLSLSLSLWSSLTKRRAALRNNCIEKQRVAWGEDNENHTLRAPSWKSTQRKWQTEVHGSQIKGTQTVLICNGCSKSTWKPSSPIDFLYQVPKKKKKETKELRDFFIHSLRLLEFKWLSCILVPSV